jgi:hypothetical protein
MLRKRHPKFPSYLIGEDGVVIRDQPIIIQPTGEVMIGRLIRGGYRQYTLRDNFGQKRYISANRLICETFKGPPPTASHQAAHLDGNPHNDAADNLDWKTPKQNGLDRYFHGTILRGDKHPTTKYPNALILKIKAEYTGTRGEITRLASRYQVSPAHVRRIVKGLARTYL